MQDSQVEAAPDQGDETKGDVRAWARWVAKSIDMGLYMPFHFALMFATGALIGYLSWNSPELQDFILSEGPAQTAFWWAVSIFAYLLLFPVIEAAIIALFGSTPGKTLMGIRVDAAGGGNLSFWASFRRSYGAVFFGLALFLPFVSLMTMLLSFQHLQERGSTGWDRRSGAVTQTAPVNGLRWVFGVVLVVAARAVDFAVGRMG